MRRLLPRTRAGALWRFTLAAVLIIAFAAAATAVAGLLQFKQLASDFGQNPSISLPHETIAPPGKPQTLLLIGSDHRAVDPYNVANTDSMLLVRLNAKSQTVNVISVPRDLEVQLPSAGGGTAPQKLNAAYSIGGPKLLISTLKSQVFPGLQVNHVIDVNFTAFSDLVDALGCVYSDVDHRYYNDTALTDYSSIDIQPGYQKLCGDNQSASGALAFVRFRHTDTDIVRNARQQDFLRWTKDQYGVAKLLDNRDKLLKIFGKNAQTDHNLQTTDGLINLFNLVAFSAGHTLKQVPFPAILPNQCTTTSCFVTAESGPEGHAFREFMQVNTAKQAKPVIVTSRTPAKKGKAAPPSSVTPSLFTDVAGGQQQASLLGNVGMPVYYPKALADGSQYCLSEADVCPVEIPSPSSYPRKYHIHGPSGQAYAAYRLTVELNATQGQYYGIQGTTWRNPPLLSSPSETRIVSGKNLLIYANGGKINNVAWKTPQGVYWVSNTLTDDLSNQQMIAIAASLTKAP